jgi:FkbM family methyltransferase
MKARLKRIIRNWFRNRGFLIVKHPRAAYQQLSIFDLGVNLMMRAQGANIRFVQIGANDGVYGDSISRYSLKHAWEGILVEPQPEVFQRLVENYRSAPGKCHFENVAIAGGHCSEITLWRPNPLAAGNSDSTVASVSRERTMSQAKHGEMEAIQVPCTTIKALLEKHQWFAVDILLIDTEGLDYEVLQTIDFSRIKPTIIQFEHGHLSPKEIDGAIALLNSHGYHIAYGGITFDTIAIHETAWERWGL